MLMNWILTVRSDAFVFNVSRLENISENTLAKPFTDASSLK